ncbi:uncharacterized protein LOC135493843 [Lineus longissimus]|uniref:uncharacterized protein LOC135493843 n=1 Tax=Lineus longissimus TaxID=88925 RepID=UPI00315CED67
MYTPRWTGSEMWSQLTSPVPSTAASTPRYGPFDEKRRELQELKKRVQTHLGELNVLRSDYMDWFKKKNDSFLNVVKYVQYCLPGLVPENITTFKHFKETFEMCQSLRKSGTFVKDAQLLEEYFAFWERLTKLKEEGDGIVYTGVMFFCGSITSLRHPEIRDYIDKLQERYTAHFNDEFDFTDVHDEKDILFTYKVSTINQRFLGLMQYLPYILQIARKICYFALKLHVEKE